MLGPIVTTALRSGAIATQWRADQPLFGHILFEVHFGATMWGGLWLRDPDLRAVTALRKG